MCGATSLVVCHLGGGSSVTGVRDGRSADTTMGFSPLEGVPMATRSGSIDPAIPAYLVREHGMDVAGVERALTTELRIGPTAAAYGPYELSGVPDPSRPLASVPQQ